MPKRSSKSEDVNEAAFRVAAQATEEAGAAQESDRAAVSAAAAPQPGPPRGPKGGSGQGENPERHQTEGHRQEGRCCAVEGPTIASVLAYSGKIEFQNEFARCLVFPETNKAKTSKSNQFSIERSSRDSLICRLDEWNLAELSKVDLL